MFSLFLLLNSFGLLNSFVFTNSSEDFTINEPKSNFGYSISGYKFLNKIGFLVGAPKSGDGGKLFFCERGKSCQDLTNIFFQKNHRGKNFTKSLFGSTIVPFKDKHIVCAPNTRTENTKIFLSGFCFSISNSLKIIENVNSNICSNLQSNPKDPLSFRNCLFGMSTSATDTTFLVSTPLYRGRGIGEISWDLKDFTDSTNDSVMPNQMLGYSTANSNKVTSAATEFMVLGGPGIPEAAFENVEVGGPEGIIKVFAADSSVDYILKGKEFASAFGTAVLLIDLNNDGYDDLIVGAPQELHVEDKINFGKYRYGIVHVFMNRRNDVRPFDFTPGHYYTIKPPVELSERSGFGSVLNNLGDINQDGIQDFSISAPASQDHGKVIIYLGSKESQITEPVQIISGRKDQRGFGKALSYNQIDLNKDGIIDIAIGSPIDGTVSVFFGKTPIEIKFDHNMTPKPCSRPLSGYHMNSECQELSISSYYTTKEGICFDQNLEIDILIKMNADGDWWNEYLNASSQFFQSFSILPIAKQQLNMRGSFEWPLSNTYFKNETSYDLARDKLTMFWKKNISALTRPDPTKNGYVFSTLALSCQNGRKEPKKFEIITRNPHLEDGTRGLQIGLKWSMKEIKGDRNRPPSQLPAVNSINNIGFIELRKSQERDKITFEKSIQIDSSTDKDGLVMYVNNDIDAPLKIRSTIRNTGSNPIRGLTFLTLYDQNLFNLVQGEVLKNGVALCVFSLSIESGELSECLLEFRIKYNIEDVAQPFSYLNSTFYQNMLPMEGSETRIDKVNIKQYIWLQAESRLDPSITYFSGNVSGTTGEGENSLGNTRVVYTVRITQSKKETRLTKGKLVIHWPYELTGDASESHGPYMLYLLDYPRFTTNSNNRIENILRCDSKALRKLVNVYSKKIFNNKRSLGEHVELSDDVSPPKQFDARYPDLLDNFVINSMEDKKFETQLSCFNGQVRCVPIICDMENLNFKTSPIEISFVARIWEDTNRLQFKNLHLVKLNINATWYPDLDFQIESHQHYKPNTIAELSMYNNMKKSPVPPRLKPLYLALGVIAGVILLGILIVILIAAGFFKRRKVTDI